MFSADFNERNDVSIHRVPEIVLKQIAQTHRTAIRKLEQCKVVTVKVGEVSISFFSKD